MSLQVSVHFVVLTVKLFLLQMNFHDKTPYTIMFGPDKCGNDHKVTMTWTVVFNFLSTVVINGP